MALSTAGALCYKQMEQERLDHVHHIDGLILTNVLKAPQQLEAALVVELIGQKALDMSSVLI